MTSIPLNIFNTPPDPNARNNLSYSKVSPQYFNRNRQLDPTKKLHNDLAKGNPSEVDVEHMGEYVTKELKKVKVSLSAFELLRVTTIRNSFFLSLIRIAP